MYKACSHITGGGFYENIPRMLPDGTRAVIEKDSYAVPPIFKLLAETGDIEEQMMYNTYNMGTWYGPCSRSGRCRQDNGSYQRSRRYSHM